MEAERNRIDWISWLRVYAMVMIVMCHIAAQSGTLLGTAAGQFLNVGVEIFFMISGYLFGRKYIQISYKKWISNRIVRIIPSYYLFLLVLAIVHLIIGIHQSNSAWLISLFCLQGIECYLIGAEHLWFLTVMLACYIITPVLDTLKKKSQSHMLLVAFIGLNMLLQAWATFMVSVQLGRYWHLINLYMIAYLLGMKKFCCSNIRELLIGITCGLLAVVLRLVGRHYVDGTVFYNIYIVGITHAILAVSIMMMVQYFFNRAPGKMIIFLDRISFEIYLVHFMLINGPISMMNLTGSYLLNSMVSCTAAVVLATALSFAGNGIIKKIRR